MRYTDPTRPLTYLLEIIQRRLMFLLVTENAHLLLCRPISGRTRQGDLLLLLTECMFHESD